MQLLPWIILFLPLLACATIVLVTRHDRLTSARLSIAAMVGSFLLTAAYVCVFGWQPERKEVLVTWLEAGDLQVDLGLRLDPLSLLMLLIVTGVGSAIHIYSFGYMREDRGISRYFACLSLFSFSMLGIVLANNFLMLFIFWELVGVSSYLLIGFWYERAAAADAAKKAFLTNRLGDFGFLLGILLVWQTYGTLNFSALQAAVAQDPQAFGNLATLAGLLIFCGAAGKSAQFPLHVWLPDAMEGPTPVSALIHAATMVAAGVYLLCRVFFLLEVPGSFALEIIAWIGGITALLAALIAVQQNDIKRILAYSTLSQLGYMVVAVGVHAPVSAMFHLTTHAFFKALLFLGAGAVIHGLHHQQDIWEMGGLSRKMRVTYVTFLIGTLALAGVPPFSGFFSKDAILAAAAHRQPALFVLGIVVAVLTAFYMGRLMFIAFLSPARSESAAHAHDAPPIMTWPLLVLAVPAALGGFWGIENVLQRQFNPAQVTEPLPWWQELFAPFGHAPLASVLGLFAALVGFSAAAALYRNATHDRIPESFGALARAMRQRFYFDEIFAGFIRVSHEALAGFADTFDRWMVSGLLVRGTHGVLEFSGRALRLLQTGNLQAYAFFFVLGLAVLLFFALVR